MDVLLGELVSYLWLTPTVCWPETTSGNAAVFGHDCQSDSLKARSAVGYLQAKWDSIPIPQDTKCCRSGSASEAQAFPVSIGTT
jgi:hypothetical protein